MKLPDNRFSVISCRKNRKMLLSLLVIISPCHFGRPRENTENLMRDPASGGPAMAVILRGPGEMSRPGPFA
jgi:hypothetical protein